jgi:hypothetical protein
MLNYLKDFKMYKFDPTLYGYDQLADFPELIDFLPRNSFVKIIVKGGPDFDRAVYWFSYCSNDVGLGHDERWEIRGSSYCDGKKEISISGNHRNYLGLIGSKEFAELLLTNIFGTNSNHPNDGPKRLEQYINKNRLQRD